MSEKRILVADGGSTKVDWLYRASSDQKPVRYACAGLNPLLLTADEIALEVQSALPGIEPHEVYFYGASCSGQNRKDVMRRGLSSVFPEACVVVHHDLTGAGRALWQDESGIAGILGTGCNCGFYNGNTITKQMFSLGYLIGDEGSGADIGRYLLRGYFYGRFSRDLTEQLKPHIPHDAVDIVHASKRPNFKLADFARVAGKFKNEPEIKALVRNRIEEFVAEHAVPLKNEGITRAGFVGSIALHFCDELREALAAHGLQLEKCVHKPVDELLNYHLNHETN